VKPVRCSNLDLEALHFSIGKFDDLPALGTDKVIVMPPKMPMFVSYGLVFKLFPLRESQFHHTIHTLANEFGIVVVSFFLEEPKKFLKRNVIFSVEKRVNYIQPILYTIHLIGFKKRSQIRLFENIPVIHISSSQKLILILFPACFPGNIQ